MPAGARVNAKDDVGRTPLYNTLAYRVSQIKDVSVATALLQQGADPNMSVTTDRAFGDDVRTPLQLAVYLKGLQRIDASTAPRSEAGFGPQTPDALRDPGLISRIPPG